jgi:hypothetical protein
MSRITQKAKFDYSLNNIMILHFSIRIILISVRISTPLIYLIFELTIQ